MPIYLENRDVVSELCDCRSVLIVPCPICPAISLAVSGGEPYIDFFRRFLGTAAYGRAIAKLQTDLDAWSVRTKVYQSILPMPLMCMWSTWQRSRMLKHARPHDAVVVLGCDAALHTVRQAVAPTGCRVLNGMRVEGIVSVTPKLHWPATITLETRSRRCVAWPDQ